MVLLVFAMFGLLEHDIKKLVFKTNKTKFEWEDLAMFFTKYTNDNSLDSSADISFYVEHDNKEFEFEYYPSTHDVLNIKENDIVVIDTCTHNLNWEEDLINIFNENGIDIKDINELDINKDYC